MFKIFIGLFFLFLDFNVGGISVTPAFVGYFLIWKGMKETTESMNYQMRHSQALLACGVSAIYWARSFFDQSYGMVGMILMMAVMILQLMVTQNLNNGVVELQTLNNIDLRARQLVMMWNVMAVGSIAVIFTRLLMPVLMVAAALVYFAGCVGYTAFYYQAASTWKKYGGKAV